MYSNWLCFCEQFIDDPDCAALGCRATWGFGNQLLVFAGKTRTQAGEGGGVIMTQVSRWGGGVIRNCFKIYLVISPVSYNLQKCCTVKLFHVCFDLKLPKCYFWTGSDLDVAFNCHMYVCRCCWLIPLCDAIFLGKCKCDCKNHNLPAGNDHIMNTVLLLRLLSTTATTTNTHTASHVRAYIVMANV